MKIGYTGMIGFGKEGLLCGAHPIFISIYSVKSKSRRYHICNTSGISIIIRAYRLR